MASSRSTVFGGGSTFGIANDVVTPPAAQAAVAVTMSLLAGEPGLAVVRVDVDRAGQDVASRWRRSSSSPRAACRGDDRGDPLVADGEVGQDPARRVTSVPPRIDGVVAVHRRLSALVAGRVRWTIPASRRLLVDVDLAADEVTLEPVRRSAGSPCRGTAHTQRSASCPSGSRGAWGRQPLVQGERVVLGRGGVVLDADDHQGPRWIRSTTSIGR